MAQLTISEAMEQDFTTRVLSSVVVKALKIAYRERGAEGVRAKFGEWGNQLTPEEETELKHLAGIPE